MRLTWSPALALGVDAIDDQHREIFRRVADLTDAIDDNRGTASMKLLLEFLSRYVVQHFSEEEQLMREHDYPELVPHQGEHAKFLASFETIRVRQENVALTAATMLELSTLTTGWLTAHIGHTDKAFATYLKSRYSA